MKIRDKNGFLNPVNFKLEFPYFKFKVLGREELNLYESYTYEEDYIDNQLSFYSIINKLGSQGKLDVLSIDKIQTGYSITFKNTQLGRKTKQLIKQFAGNFNWSIFSEDENKNTITFCFQNLIEPIVVPDVLYCISNLSLDTVYEKGLFPKDNRNYFLTSIENYKLELKDGMNEISIVKITPPNIPFYKDDGIYCNCVIPPKYIIKNETKYIRQ